MSAEPTVSIEEESFGFADEDLAGLCDRLGEEGVDVPALLTELAAMDPDRQMRRYRAIAIRRAMIGAQVKRETVRLEAWRYAKVSSLDKELAFLAQGLTNAARSLVERTKGRVKKLETPWGYVQIKDLPISLTITDVDAALAALPEKFIRVTREVDKKGLLAAMKTGEVEAVPGVTMARPEEDSVTIKPALPDLEVADDAKERT